MPSESLTACTVTTESAAAAGVVGTRGGTRITYRIAGLLGGFNFGVGVQRRPERFGQHRLGRLVCRRVVNLIGVVGTQERSADTVGPAEGASPVSQVRRRGMKRPRQPWTWVLQRG
jgi:hypothetical protein